jgi:DNA-binding NtrC family response regulator
MFMLGQARILVVDDDADVCEVIATILREEGCEVVTLRSAAALGSLDALDGFDLAVVDMVMVGSSGWHVDRVAAAGIPALFISGYLEPPRTPPAGHAFLQKPFDSSRLLPVVERLLAGRRGPPISQPGS